MNAPTKLTAFAAALGVAFGGAALAGAAIGPTSEPTVREDAASGGGAGPAGGGNGHAGGGHGAGGEQGEHGGDGALGGLAVSQGGYALDLERPLRRADDDGPVRFRIVDGRGRAVRDGFEAQHEKEMHFIVVRRDTSVFRHVHPTREPDGTWSVDVDLPDAGTYRAYADFRIGGQKRTLASDLSVPGRFTPESFPAPERSARAVDEAGGLDVAVKAPGLRAGRETRMTFSVGRDGRPFEALEPYLGAKGHLVALREGDLGYLHVHPLEGGAEREHEDGSTSDEAHESEVPFMATFPTPGTYRLFLQFKTDGQIRTVDYTVEVPR